MGSAAWPAVAAQLAKNIAKDSFAHDYPRVWGYLHPTYQKAVSQSHWQACQKSHPAAPRNIKITRVAVAQANELPVDLSLLGHQNVQEIQVYVQYKTPALAGSAGRGPVHVLAQAGRQVAGGLAGRRVPGLQVGVVLPDAAGPAALLTSTDKRQRLLLPPCGGVTMIGRVGRDEDSGCYSLLNRVYF